MRNLVLFSTLLVSIVGPSFVSGAPTPSRDPNVRLVRRGPANQIIDTPVTEALGISKPPNNVAGGHPNDSDSGGHVSHGQEDPTGPKYKPEAFGEYQSHSKRATDNQTAGGNAYSGSTGDVTSGSVYNDAGQGTVTNNGGNNSAKGGNTISGDARGGDGDGVGPGGNAYTGSAGDASGGSIFNIGGTVNNMGTNQNNAGEGGVSKSGYARGGNS